MKKKFVEFQLSAPAKINLSLELKGRRDDGFHEIETVIAKLPGLADFLYFTPAAELVLNCDDASLPIDENNLVIKAVRAFEKHTGQQVKCEIFLVKRIPHGAGLGGGSSDAAATLLGLERIYGGTDAAMRQEMAAEIGSDVSCFLHDGKVKASGRGEVIEPWEYDCSGKLVLFKPSFGVSTPKAYQAWAESKILPHIPYREQRWFRGFALLNHLERPVFEKHLFLGVFKKWLLKREEVRFALMSGSGSTMFAILNHGHEAESLIKAAKAEIDPTLWTWSGDLSVMASSECNSTGVSE